MRRTNFILLVGTITFGLGVILCFAESVLAQGDQVVQLQRKVAELEAKVKQLEGLLEECVGPPGKGMPKDYGWQNKMNWRKLETGMSEIQVRSILGEPTKVIKGVKTLWYYPNIYGGFVSFDTTGKVAGWNEP